MEVERFSLPLAEPLQTAAGAIEHREGFLVTVGEDGVRGLGEAAPLPGWTESLAACGRTLRSVADGDRAAEAVDAGERPAAAHALGLAEADLAARQAAVPLARWLADDLATAVPVNATIGDADVDATVGAARRAVEDGFDCLKLKVGARPLAADLERVRAVADTLDGVELRVDANGAWSRSAASNAVDQLVALPVSYVEQPLAPADIEGHAELRGHGVGIALDESLRARSLAAILTAQAADVLVVKPMALGGVRRARDVARRARDRGVDPVVTTTVDGVVARTGALHLAASLGMDRACGLATGHRLVSDLAPDPAPVRDGRLSVPDGPGLGVTLARS